MKRFNEDMIRRNDLPKDVFGLIHDLCYDHDGRDFRASYVQRAQDILKAEVSPNVKTKRRRNSRDRGRVAKPVSRAQKPALSECDNCDGCGWTEGGKFLQTECNNCGGTGKCP